MCGRNIRVASQPCVIDMGQQRNVRQKHPCGIAAKCVFDMGQQRSVRQKHSCSMEAVCVGNEAAMECAAETTV